MSSMVDPRPETVKAELVRCGEGGSLIWLVKARFVLTAAVIAAALSLGLAGRGVGRSGGGAVARMPDLRLDPNTAPPEVLAALPHVGTGLVDRWVRAREERPLCSLEDARTRVRGLGPATLEQIGPYFDFPQARGIDPARIAKGALDRPAGKTRATRRKKAVASKGAATQQLRLAARISDPAEL
jgi:competence protein ComEA